MAQGIADRLATTPPLAVEQSSWKWGAVALAVAACVAIVVLWYPRSSEMTGGSSLPQAGKQLYAELPPPTMLAYQRMLVESPDALDELLDRHASQLLVASSGSNVTASLYQDLMTNQVTERAKRRESIRQSHAH